MKNLAIIVCNSGQGHLKRVLWILGSLLKTQPEEMEVNIFVDSLKLSAFQQEISKLQAGGHQINFYDIKSNVEAYENEFISRYGQHLQNADYVWSDNLTFPLKYHNRVFLTGQFLWSEIIKDRNFVDSEIKTLKEKRPRMIGIDYFSTPRAKQLTSFEGVAIYNFYPLDFNGIRSDAILLSCGNTLNAQNYFQDEIKPIKKVLASLPENLTVFVEPKFFPQLSDCRGIEKADFREEMFKRLKAAVIRPGMGTVCDCLTKGVKIFAFSEGKNFEIKHNTTILKKLGVGDRCSGALQALKSALKYIQDYDLQDQHLGNMRKLQFGGVSQTVTKIAGLFKENRVYA